MKAPKEKDKILARFKAGPDLLKGTIAGLKDKDLDKASAKGGWSIRQIVHHLADGDDIWKIAIKQALANDKSEFSLEWYRAMPQIAWADRWEYAKRSVDVSLEFLKASRKQLLQLLEYVPDGWNKSVRFIEANAKTEIITVGFIIKMQADHIEHHVKQIKSILNNT